MRHRAYGIDDRLMRAYTQFMSAPCHCTRLRIATRKMTALYDTALAPTGINVAQFSILRTIERRQPVSLTELGRLLALDRSTMGRNVRVLEKQGLVALGAARPARGRRFAHGDRHGHAPGSRAALGRLPDGHGPAPGRRASHLLDQLNQLL